MTIDLDAFYSQETIDEWKQIIGEELHYHFGYFRGGEDLETGLRQTVRNFYPHIPVGSRVLDVGCGWGGPAKMLKKERNCSVQGVTISRAQAAYCRSIGLDVWRCNIEEQTISGQYDIVFMLEVLSHIRDKEEMLQRLRHLAPRLILSINCIADNIKGSRTAFGGSMVLCSKSELEQALERAGWRIHSMRNRRFQSIPTLMHWKKNLERVFGEQRPPGQLAALQNLTKSAFQSVGAWGQAFPLIDLVAE